MAQNQQPNRLSRDAERTRQAIAEMRRARQELANAGAWLKQILEPGESLRELAHATHRL